MTEKAMLKEQIITELIETRRQILEAASALTPAQQDQVFLGTWSVKDLLAHLVGWDYTNREAVQAILRGKLPAFYSRYDHDWQSYNTHLVARYRREDWAELLASVEESLR